MLTTAAESSKTTSHHVLILISIFFTAFKCRKGGEKLFIPLEPLSGLLFLLGV